MGQTIIWGVIIGLEIQAVQIYLSLLLTQTGS